MKDTQKAHILEYLRSGRSLTALDALHHFSCFRLAPRVLELRLAGHDIQTEMVRRGNKSYAQYRLDTTRYSATAAIGRGPLPMPRGEDDLGCGTSGAGPQGSVGGYRP